MPFKIFRQRPEPHITSLPLFDESFLRRLERLNFRTASSLRGVMVGEQRSRNLRPALDFSDHRPYSTGDDLRHVDWNAYARHEELFVKLGEATQGVDIHILLDYSRSMTWEPAWPPPTFPTSEPASQVPEQPFTRHTTKWASARRLAGALGYLSLSSGERLLITPLAAELGQTFGPTHGKRRVIPALQFHRVIS